jgi:hypothetical protein
MPRASDQKAYAAEPPREARQSMSQPFQCEDFSTIEF